jgi:hypothetical protein
MQASVVTESQRSAAAANDHTRTSSQQTPDEDRSTQQKLTWFTGVLAAVGVLQLVVMFLTWLIYRRQAREMRRQRHEMRQQRHMMWRQWKVMEGQLSQMEGSGKQTDELIRHAGNQAGAMIGVAAAISMQTEETKTIGRAANTSAEAAKDSADALVNSERPWIVASLQKADETAFWFAGKEKTVFNIRFTLSFKNYGSTPAKIVSVRECPRVVKMWEDLGETPEYELDMQAEFVNERLLVPNESWDYTYTDVQSMVPPDTFSELEAGKRLFVYYGRIQYRDIFRPEVRHETRFCYSYRSRIATFVIEGPAEYTKYT